MEVSACRAWVLNHSALNYIQHFFSIFYVPGTYFILIRRSKSASRGLHVNIRQGPNNR